MYLRRGRRGQEKEEEKSKIERGDESDQNIIRQPGDDAQFRAVSLSAKLRETLTPQVTRAHHGVYSGHKWDMRTQKEPDLDVDWVLAEMIFRVFYVPKCEEIEPMRSSIANSDILRVYSPRPLVRFNLVGYIPEYHTFGISVLRTVRAATGCPTGLGPLGYPVQDSRKLLR